MTVEPAETLSDSSGETRTDAPEGNDTGDSSKTLQGVTEARDRYRGERDTARDELAAAVARIEAVQRNEVERFAAEGGLSLPSDVFTLSGNGVADYLGDDGNVDPEKVSADVSVILQERPGLKRGTLAFDPSRSTGGQTPQKRSPTALDLLRADYTL